MGGGRDEWVESGMNGWMVEWMDVRWIDGERRMDGGMERWLDGWM